MGWHKGCFHLDCHRENVALQTSSQEESQADKVV
jgi:hypothetical protein